MLSVSRVLYSLLMNTLCEKTPHARIEIMVKEITKEVMVHGGLGQLIMNVKGVVMIEINEKDYLDFQGINDPKPEAMKVVWIMN